jgi:hypothetical protein
VPAVRVARVVFVALLLAACSGDGDGSESVRSGSPGDEAVDTSGAPRIGDHWHVAVELSVCGDALPAPTDAGPDVSGIHSHSDGLIHIHPFTEEFTGEGAVLGAFLDTVGVEVGDDGLQLDDNTSVPFEGECDNEPARLVVSRWASGDHGDPTVTVLESAEDLRAILLDEDGMALAIGLVGEGGELPPPASAASAPSDVAPSGEQAPRATGQGTNPGPIEGVALAPVLGIGAPPCGPTTVAGGDGETCYELGPVGLGADGVESAEAAEAASQWAVDITLTEAGLDALNALAEQCFGLAATCPSGQLAIVVGTEVLSAPTVQVPSFERDSVQIYGGTSEVEARALAEAING